MPPEYNLAYRNAFCEKAAPIGELPIGTHFRYTNPIGRAKKARDIRHEGLSIFSPLLGTILNILDRVRTTEPRRSCEYSRQQIVDRLVHSLDAASDPLIKRTQSYPLWGNAPPRQFDKHGSEFGCGGKRLLKPNARNGVVAH
jgi:hypothetical protein